MAQGDRLEQARQTGHLAAARELRRLRLDQTRAIDVFRVIVEADLWLLFKPLDKLLGAYVRVGSGGILINTQRPRGMQRLTAAHEYGHHVLRHEGSLDYENQVQNPRATRNAQEVAAQAFAMDFLMPPRLVNVLWNDLSIPRHPEAYHAYLLSLYLGTSYQATVYQLVASEKISSDLASQLLKVEPKQIKRQIGGGLGPRNPWAEIWPVDRSHDSGELAVAVEDEVRLCLPEAPATGYVWVTESESIIDLRDQEGAVGDAAQAWRPSDPVEPGPEHVLGLVRSEFESADRDLFSAAAGGDGHRYLTFRALRPGICTLQLALRRPWQSDGVTSDQFCLRLQLLGKPAGDAEGGYLDDAKNVLALPAAA